MEALVLPFVLKAIIVATIVFAPRVGFERSRCCSPQQDSGRADRLYCISTNKGFILKFLKRNLDMSLTLAFNLRLPEHTSAAVAAMLVR